VIRQGEIYWLDDDEPVGSEPGYRRPWVILQNNVLNGSGIRTVVAAPCSTNLRRRNTAGTVMLRRGEGGLPSDSLVVAAGISATARIEFREVDYLGSVSTARVLEVLRAVRQVMDPRD